MKLRLKAYRKLSLIFFLHKTRLGNIKFDWNFLDFYFSFFFSFLDGIPLKCLPPSGVTKIIDLKKKE